MGILVDFMEHIAIQYTCSHSWFEVTRYPYLIRRCVKCNRAEHKNYNAKTFKVCTLQDYERILLNRS